MEKLTKYEKQERINQSLIHSAQAGDAASMDKLLLNNSEMIERWLYKKTIGKHYLVEDLVQESLIKISSNLLRYTFQNKFTSFCLWNTEQVWINWLREAKTVECESLVDSGTFADDELYDDDVYIKLEKVVDGLKNKEMKTVLKMHLFNHLSNQQIVEHTGLSESYVKTLISRGKDKVKENYF